MDLLIDVGTDLVYISTIMIYLQPASVTQLAKYYEEAEEQEEQKDYVFIE